MELKISNVDDSGDILFPMLLHGWIRFSPIVSLLHLISYSLIIQYVYKFRCCFLELRNGTELWATCWRFYTCLSQGVYIAGQSNLVCLHYIVCSYNIGYKCYVKTLAGVPLKKSWRSLIVWPLRKCTAHLLKEKVILKKSRWKLSQNDGRMDYILGWSENRKIIR